MQRAHCVEAGPGTPSVGYAKRETISQPARLESSLLIVASFPLAENLDLHLFLGRDLEHCHVLVLGKDLANIGEGLH